jgi:tetratricopeptide (TPR) repeat protein
VGLLRTRATPSCPRHTPGRPCRPLPQRPRGERDTRAHNALGDTPEALGHLDQAASSYTRATELDPDSITAYLKLSTVLRDAGRRGEADVAFASALARRPRLADDFFLLTNGYLALGRPDDAMASYRAALTGLDEDRLDERPLRLEGNRWVRGYVGVFRQAQRSPTSGWMRRTCKCARTGGSRRWRR